MIYFIQAGENGPIKIGYSKSPNLRLAKLQTGNSNPLRILASIEGDYKKEAELHKKFSNLRADNEWFFPAKSLLDFIKLHTDNHCCDLVLSNGKINGASTQLSLWETQNSITSINEKLIVIYHDVLNNETFEMAAQHLFSLIKYAQEKFPNKPRALFIDILGHRNEVGGFDYDMFELINEFSIGFLTKWLTELCTPILRIQNLTQNNEVPAYLIIRNGKSS